MTIRVIDASRPLPPTYGDHETALTLGDGDTVILAAGSTIAAYGYDAWAVFGGRNVTALLDGRVHSASATAVAMHGTVIVGATGEIFGSDYGIQLVNDPVNGRPNVLTNAGIISSGDDWVAGGSAVIVTGGPATITNTGTIKGIDGGITLSGGDAAVIANSGTILGGIWGPGYGHRDQQLTVENSGLIEATAGTAFDSTSYSSAILRNSGQIKGNVYFGFGNDVYDGRGGTITGVLHLFGGDDVVYGGSGSEKIYVTVGDYTDDGETYSGGGNSFIDGGGGIDELKYNLSDYALTIDLRLTDRQQTGIGSSATLRNIENIVGSRFADRITGNDAANDLWGNGGGDTLDGGGGDDILGGGGLDSVLIGGAGTDVAKFFGAFSGYRLSTQANGTILVMDASGSHRVATLSGVEFAQFSDRTIALGPGPNAAPSSIDLDGGKVGSGAAVGSVVGRLSGVDPDGDPLGFFLVDDAAGRFRIHGDKLLLARPLSSPEDLSIVVRASDPSGASLDRRFTIDVTAAITVDSAASLPDAGTAAGEPVPQALRLKGGRNADRLVGGDGDDRLDGGLGRDRLTGDDGADVFAFSTRLAAANLDTITDFRSGEDMMHLSARIFGRIGKGGLADEAFRSGRKALDADDRILYDARTGAVLYDADGSGTSHAAVKFAQLKARSALDHEDFRIV